MRNFAFNIKKSYKEKIEVLEDGKIFEKAEFEGGFGGEKRNIIVTISREHGTNGKEIAKQGNCIIVGRAADYILRNYKTLNIFLYAPMDYKLSVIKKIYNDSPKEAAEYIKKSDKSRKTYYEYISNQIWGNKQYYDLCLDCQIGNEKSVDILSDYVYKVYID